MTKEPEVKKMCTIDIKVPPGVDYEKEFEKWKNDSEKSLIAMWTDIAAKHGFIQITIERKGP